MTTLARVALSGSIATALFAVVVNAFVIVNELQDHLYARAGWQCFAPLLATLTIWGVVAMDHWRKKILEAISADIATKRTLAHRLLGAQRIVIGDEDDDQGVRH